MSQKIYQFVGAGAGIVGLPKQITVEEAEQLDPETKNLLEEAIKNGVYRESVSTATPEPKPTRARRQKQVEPPVEEAATQSEGDQS